MQRRLQPKPGNKDGLTATLIVTVAIGILLVPICLVDRSAHWRVFLVNGRLNPFDQKHVDEAAANDPYCWS